MNFNASYALNITVAMPFNIKVQKDDFLAEIMLTDIFNTIFVFAL